MQQNSNTLIAIFLLAIVLFVPSLLHAEGQIKVGVPLALTGDLAPMGLDAKDGIQFAQEQIGASKYSLLFEDEKCSGKEAVTIAQKLLAVDQVKYVVGLSCNTALLASAPIYERAGVVVISPTATSGDIVDIGKGIFRLLPADHFGAIAIYKYAYTRHKKIAVITEEEEYALLLERTFKKLAQEDTSNEVSYDQFPNGSKEVRSLLLRVAAKKPDAIFLNAAGEGTFIPLLKQVRDLKIPSVIYAQYTPSSKVVQDALGSALNGVRFADLPDARDRADEEGKKLLAQMDQRFGSARSFSLVRPMGYESFKLLHEALESGMNLSQYLHSKEFSSALLGKFHFDEHNQISGIAFQMKEIRDGKIVPLN